MGTGRGMVKDSQIMLQFAIFILKSRFGVMGTHVNTISPVKATGQATRKFPLQFKKGTRVLAVYSITSSTNKFRHCSSS
jgi:hypothetical protein